MVHYCGKYVYGLGRLRYAEETLTNSSQQAIGYSCSYNYDMRSQLAASSISGIAGGNWSAEYDYRENGDIIAKTINSGQPTSFTYNGNLMTGASGGENLTLGWDNNGNLISSSDGTQATSYEYNWDNKLRSAQKGSSTISLRYDPAGNRILKNSSSSGTRKYIVDIVGDLPTILLEMDTSGSIKKTYTYANSQIIAQHDGSHTANRYFYLHDRLGSVRQIINTSGNVVNYYTYEPFGETLESSESITNPFKFTGQYFDSEIGLYYLRNRQYHPKIYRFTSRDLVAGDFQNPLSLHKYLYCENEPVNQIDPRGLWTIHVMLSGMFSFGPSLMYQRGIVVDDKGNWGWITTSNDPHAIEGLDNNWGLGVGTPAVGAGVAFGWTNADTIFDLVGPGITIGGSVSPIPPWGIGIDYLQGIQRSGEYYYGFEVVPGVGASTTGPWEVHSQATWTTVRPWESNQQEGIDIIRESVENSMFDAQTLGQGEALLAIWGYLR